MLNVADSPGTAMIGRERPGLCPPEPAKSLLREWKAQASRAKIKPFPWQPIAANYMMATGPKGDWLYPDVCIAAARQNGKTELLVPRILYDLSVGRRVLHTAHRMRLPRKIFLRVAPIAERDGGTVRYAQGQEEIVMKNGGSYAIIAAQRGPRGESADTLIVDEVREFEDFDAVAASTPTLAASPNPQTIYLSNAGSDLSVVLNDLKRRGEEGAPDLAYLEWSAAESRSPDDPAGWAEANPALGHLPHMFSFLQKQRASVPLPEFETEHLCRWVASMRPKLVPNDAWQRCRADPGASERPAMAVSMDAQHGRASAVISWRMADGRMAIEQLVDARGDPALDTDALQTALRKMALERRVRKVGFAAWTDAALTRGWNRAQAVDNKDFATACGLFTELVTSGRLAWDGDDLIGDDLAFATRKPHESGAWVAVPASQERPITAALAAIRAVYLASERHTLPRIG